MKQAVERLLHFARGQLQRAGVSVHAVRGRRGRVGIHVVWGSDDSRVERVAISKVVQDGCECFFLIRDESDYIQSHFLLGKFYADKELRLVRTHYKTGTFVDVGANVGNHTVFAAKVLNAEKVISIEPNPEAFQILRCNIALNDINSLVVHLPIGLSDSDGYANIDLVFPGNLGSTQLTKSVTGSVPVIRGDDLLIHEKIGFIKVDVEGLEMAVLAGLRKTIDQNRPPMLIEVDDTNRKAFDQFRVEHGYRVEAELRPYPSNANFLILPNDPTG